MKIITLLTFLLLSSNLLAREYLIYSIDQDLPMGVKGEVIRKNYYLNMGSQQGIKKGTILSVTRTISKQNPYDNRKMVNYSVNIGKIKVLHTGDEASIAVLEKFENEDSPLFDIGGFMVGDQVSISLH